MKRQRFFKTYIILTILIGAIGISCNKFEKATVADSNLIAEIPDYGNGFGTQYNSMIHLGRILFYDKALSRNNAISCASCHKQELAFADNADFSTGFEGRKTLRNSLPLQNLNTFNSGFGSNRLFWDGREFDLVSLITKPIANHIEMGIDDTTELLNKVNARSYVPELAIEAFGSEKLTTYQLSSSVAAFITQFNSFNSRVDRNKGQQLLGLLTAEEIRGEQLFNTTYQCGNCHNPGGFFYGGGSMRNIGLESEDADIGFMKVTGNAADKGKFKAPDLHNVALTAPYMHDGRFKTLSDVLEHYSHGIRKNPNLDPILNVNGEPLQMNITELDKASIIAFLNALTDPVMITNPNFSNPFKSN
jgi:cytochrome c peroxidase